jgi:hypothetical protein
MFVILRYIPNNLFDPVKALQEGREILFTGEMIFPSLFDDIAKLRPLKVIIYF